MQNKSIQELLNRLISAMKLALSGSEDVVHTVDEIETHGFKVLLAVDAVIQSLDQALWSAPPASPPTTPQLQLNADDATWLKSLRIMSDPVPTDLPPTSDNSS